MNTTRLYIEGLEQNETQERVREQLEGIIGVREVDLSAGQIYLDVSFDDQTSDQEINNHLQNNGYKILETNKVD